MPARTPLSYMTTLDASSRTPTEGKGFLPGSAKLPDSQKGQSWRKGRKRTTAQRHQPGPAILVTCVPEGTPAPSTPGEQHAAGRRKRKLLHWGALPKRCSPSRAISQMIAAGRWEIPRSRWAAAVVLPRVSQVCWNAATCIANTEPPRRF